MKKIIVKLSNERLITPSGLTLVGGALGKSDLVKRANRMAVDKKRSQPQIKNADILLTYIGLLCQGKTSFDSVGNSMRMQITLRETQLARNQLLFRSGTVDPYIKTLSFTDSG